MEGVNQQTARTDVGLNQADWPRRESRARRKAVCDLGPIAIEQQLFVEIEEDLRVELLQLAADLVANAALEVERVVAAAAQSVFEEAFLFRQRGNGAGYNPMIALHRPNDQACGLAFLLFPQLELW